MTCLEADPDFRKRGLLFLDQKGSRVGPTLKKIPEKSKNFVPPTQYLDPHDFHILKVYLIYIVSLELVNIFS